MTPLRILHVDDEPDIREVVEISLGLDPALVSRSCGSGQEALVLAGQWIPDVILLDVMMPMMDGPTTLAHLRANEATAKIPVVFMTARAQSRELELIRSLGAAGVIPKPFVPTTLASTVRSYADTGYDELRQLRQDFCKRLNHDAETLALYRPALDQGAEPADKFTPIREIAHRLAGSGGIFGFPAIGDAAATLEEAIAVTPETSATVKGVISALDRLLFCIHAAGDAPATNPPAIVTQA